MTINFGKSSGNALRPFQIYRLCVVLERAMELSRPAAEALALRDATGPPAKMEEVRACADLFEQEIRAGLAKEPCLPIYEILDAMGTTEIVLDLMDDYLEHKRAGTASNLLDKRPKYIALVDHDDECQVVPLLGVADSAEAAREMCLQHASENGDVMEEWEPGEHSRIPGTFDDAPATADGGEEYWYHVRPIFLKE